MKKEYVAPMIHCVNLGPQSILAASTSLKYTDTEANQDYEVLTQHKHNYWEHNWE